MLSFRLGAHPMGSVVSAASLTPNDAFHARAIGTAPIDRLELIHDGEAVAVHRPDPGHAIAELVSADPSPGYRYVRVVQTDGHLAWSSPIWIE